MSWFCRTCDTAHPAPTDKPEQCATCEAREYARDLEAELDRMTEERNAIARRLDLVRAQRDALFAAQTWDRNANGVIDDADELAAYAEWGATTDDIRADLLAFADIDAQAERLERERANERAAAAGFLRQIIARLEADE